eukprot:PITA_09640
MSMMDGFSINNQVAVHREDQKKTAFTTLWGTFMYARMPFGLINARATFQRAMDIAFIGEQDKFMVVYLDDITVFSKTDEEHILHLKITFEKCIRYGLSLNPKKSQFALSKGKLLGHIVAHEGVKIDPKRVKAINHIPLPQNKKELQAPLGRINFLRQFIPNYAEIVKGITDMLKKENEVKCNFVPHDYFTRIKKALVEAPMLVSPDYSMPFYIFSSPLHILSLLCFCRKIKKVLQSGITVFIPTTAVKDILVQGDNEGKRGRWIAKIQEYELEIKPTKLIKGQGLAKILSESNCQALGISMIIEEGRPEDHPSGIKMVEQNIYAKYKGSPRYKNIVHYLLFLRCSLGLDRSKYRSLRLQAQKYIISNGLLYWKDPVRVLLLCLVEGETHEVIEDFHGGVCGGHYNWKTTTHKILKAGFYWPTLFRDVYSQVRSCLKCQLFAERQKFSPLPLNPMHIEEPFRQCGFEFIGEINPPSSGKHKWILIATNYFTKWVEVIPTRNATDSVVIKFMEENILSRFGCPFKIITDNVQVFKSTKFTNFYHKFNIIIGHSTTYYTQGNGLAKS